MPTEPEIQTQWKNGTNILEKTRVYADDTLAAAAGVLDTFVQSFEGQYIPIGGAASVSRTRALLSSAIDRGAARAVLEPVVYEYANILAQSATAGLGSGATSAEELTRALYEWLHENSDSVETRNITYTTPSANVGNAGALTLRRLTEDKYGYDLEACHVEKKMMRVLADQNTGTKEWAERLEILGEQASFDGVRYGAFGSGDAARTQVIARHAGTGNGGSLANNSSFSSYTALATQQFDGWTEVLGGAAAQADITQDTTNVYRSHPNASTDGSLKIAMDSAADSVLLKQTIDDSRVSRLDPNKPYFLRVMVNKTVGTGAGGSVHLKLGGNTAVTTLVSALSANWTELVIPFDSTCWPEVFGEDGFDIEVGWVNGTSGFMLFDDLIFCEWDEVDGTFWLPTQNAATPLPPLLGDEWYAVDSGGTPGNGILNYWMWRAGLGYLPHSGSPTITDPV
jgi:hypothetical protein